MKKFEYNIDVEKCGLSEINKELKRLASRKCREKDAKKKEYWVKCYKNLVGIKNKRFGGKVVNKKNYMGLNEEEIKGLSIEELKDGLNVVYSMRCYYKGNEKKMVEVERMFGLYKKYIKEFEERMVFEELKKKFK